MKKLTPKEYATATKAKFSTSTTKIVPVRQPKARYVYTEKDLGEGILHMGITPSYAASLREYAHA